MAYTRKPPRKVKPIIVPKIPEPYFDRMEKINLVLKLPILVSGFLALLFVGSTVEIMTNSARGNHHLGTEHKH